MKWLLDASVTSPEMDIRGWCPAEFPEDGEEGEPVILTGLLIITDRPPGEPYGLFHPDGQDACDEWARENDEYLQRVFTEVTA